MKNSLVIIFFLFVSCKNKFNEVVCTMEFRTVNITVTGTPLNNYYTIREATGDTIRISPNNQQSDLYPVLDDNSQHLFTNQTENFRFIGIVSDTIAVNEIFSIKADQCHIEYVSGNQHVDL